MRNRTFKPHALASDVDAGVAETRVLTPISPILRLVPHLSTDAKCVPYARPQRFDQSSSYQPDSISSAWLDKVGKSCRGGHICVAALHPLTRSIGMTMEIAPSCDGSQSATMRGKCSRRCTLRLCFSSKWTACRRPWRPHGCAATVSHGNPGMISPLLDIRAEFSSTRCNYHPSPDLAGDSLM